MVCKQSDHAASDIRISFNHVVTLLKQARYKELIEFIRSASQTMRGHGPNRARFAKALFEEGLYADTVMEVARGVWESGEVPNWGKDLAKEALRHKWQVDACPELPKIIDAAAQTGTFSRCYFWVEILHRCHSSIFHFLNENVYKLLLHRNAPQDIKLLCDIFIAKIEIEPLSSVIFSVLRAINCHGYEDEIARAFDHSDRLFPNPEAERFWELYLGYKNQDSFTILIKKYDAFLQCAPVTAIQHVSWISRCIVQVHPDQEAALAFRIADWIRVVLQSIDENKRRQDFINNATRWFSYFMGTVVYELLHSKRSICCVAPSEAYHTLGDVDGDAYRGKTLQRYVKDCIAQIDDMPLPDSENITLTFVSSVYAEMFAIWFDFFKALHRPLFAVALDYPAAAEIGKKITPSMVLPLYERRIEFAQVLWPLRIRFVKKLLELGKNVLITGIDSIWFKDPFEIIDSDPYDFFAAPDFGMPRSLIVQGRHILCGDFIFFRSNPRVVNFVGRMLDMIPWYFNDQSAINMLLYVNHDITQVEDTSLYRGFSVSPLGLRFAVLHPESFPRSLPVIERLQKGDIMKREAVIGFQPNGSMEKKMKELRRMLQQWRPVKTLSA